jgi:hypothetical protein
MPTAWRWAYPPTARKVTKVRRLGGAPALPGFPSPPDMQYPAITRGWRLSAPALQRLAYVNDELPFDAPALELVVMIPSPKRSEPPPPMSSPGGAAALNHPPRPSLVRPSLERLLRRAEQLARELSISDPDGRLLQVALLRRDHTLLDACVRNADARISVRSAAHSSVPGSSVLGSSVPGSSVARSSVARSSVARSSVPPSRCSLTVRPGAREPPRRSRPTERPGRGRHHAR